MIDNCAICNSKAEKRIIVKYENSPRHPYHKKLLDASVDHMRYFFCDVIIQQCPDCGHISRKAGGEPTSEIYATDSLSCVPVSRQMMERVEGLAQFLNTKIPKNSKVADIGGGSGELSFALAGKGHCIDLFEPSLSVSTYNQNNDKGVNLINDFFEPTRLQAYDCIILKQVLEHLSNPREMLSSIHRTLKPQSILYLEIPSLEYIIENNSVADFHYQHIHYFSQNSIKRLIHQTGFEVLETINICYGHDIGYLLMRADDPVSHHDQNIHPRINVDPNNFINAIKSARKTIKNSIKGKTALYGAGAYMQAFIGLFWEEELNIHSIYDDSSISQGYSVLFPSPKN